MRSEEPGSTRDVNALVADLLPVLIPGATVDAQAPDTVVLPVDRGRARVSTRTLVAECSGRPNHEWPRLVDEWLRALSQEANTMMQAPSAPQADRLRVRAAERVGLEDGTVRVTYEEHLDLEVVEDLPDRVRALTDSDLRELGMDAREAAQVGLGNTIDSVLVNLDIRAHQLPGGITVHLGAADGVPYVSAALTSVPHVLGGELPFGAIVSSPSHDTVLLLRVESGQTVDALPMLATLAEDMFADSPYPASPALYWWYDGQLHPISASGDGAERPSISLPPALRPVIERLPAAPTPSSGSRRWRRRDR